MSVETSDWPMTRETLVEEQVERAVLARLDDVTRDTIAGEPVRDWRSPDERGPYDEWGTLARDANWGAIRMANHAAVRAGLRQIGTDLSAARASGGREPFPPGGPSSETSPLWAKRVETAVEVGVEAGLRRARQIRATDLGRHYKPIRDDAVARVERSTELAARHEEAAANSSFFRRSRVRDGLLARAASHRAEAEKDKEYLALVERTGREIDDLRAYITTREAQHGADVAQLIASYEPESSASQELESSDAPAAEKAAEPDGGIDFC